MEQSALEFGGLLPGFAAGGHGWADAIGIATAAVAMTASVRLRNTPLLTRGTLAMFGYLTAVAARYLHQLLGSRRRWRSPAC